MRRSIEIIKRLLLVPVLIAVILMGVSCDKSKQTQAGNDNQSISVTQKTTNPATEHSSTGKQTEPVITESIVPTGTVPDRSNGQTQTRIDEHNKSEGEDRIESVEIQGLVLVKDIIPDAVIELKYATKDNFTETKVYPHDICVLQKSTAMKLAKAAAELAEMGLRLKIWDAYRPLAVQKIFWDIVPDSRYVANPYTGSGSKHNRGTAVDVTIVDDNGKELEMPTGFDDFSDKASRGSKEMSEAARKNVDLLTSVMVKSGFTTITTEWWHFNDSDSDNYKALDVDLEQFLQGDAPMDNEGLKIDPYISKLDTMEGIADSQQILLVLADGLQTDQAIAYTYEKINGQWQPVFEPIDSVIGANGLTYDKKEGDSKSPTGIFSLYRCFGRNDNPGTKLLYTKFGENDFWVDDSSSKFYNTYQKGLPEGRWASAEDLYEIGDVYRYFVVIEYNTNNPVPGKGSAIFLHIWRGKGSHTGGCTAMSEGDLVKIIKWLDPQKLPLLLQYPKDDFKLN